MALSRANNQQLVDALLLGPVAMQIAGGDELGLGCKSQQLLVDKVVVHDDIGLLEEPLTLECQEAWVARAAADQKDLP